MKHVKLLPALALLMMFIPFVQSATAQDTGIEQISPIRAKLMARNGAIMIDVRTPDEVAALAYDVEGIKTIPLSEIKDRMNEIPKDKKIILACASGKRSQKAAVILSNAGYTEIANMEGGIAAWQSKDLAVIKDGKSTTKSCCADPNSKNCNPDGTCKSGNKSNKKACCEDGKKKK